MDDIRFRGRPPDNWGPFRSTGVEAWRADGKVDGLRLFVTIGAHSSVMGKKVWLWEIVETEGNRSLVASLSESLEEAMGEMEERLWGLKDKGRVR